MNKSFWTAMWCCRAVLPHMINQGSGSIVNIATHAVSGRFPGPVCGGQGRSDRAHLFPGPGGRSPGYSG